MKVTVGIVLAVLALPVYAQEAFDALDRDRNGVLSQREALADPRVSLNFEGLDRNRDRVLSAREYRLLLL